MLRVDLRSPRGRERPRYREEQVPSKAQGWWVLRNTKARGQTRTGLGAAPLLSPAPSHLLQAPGPFSRAPGFSQPPGQQRILWGRELAKVALVVPSIHSFTHSYSLSHTRTQSLSPARTVTRLSFAAWEACPATHTPPAAHWTGTR